jgi:hypothetical protein
MKMIRFSLIMLISLVMLSPSVLALDPMPSTPIRFDGEVAIDGVAVEDGTVVLVKVGSSEITTTTLNSKYSLQIPTNINLDGATEYYFSVADVEAGSHRIPIAGAYVLFDLAIVKATVAETPTDTSTTSNNNDGSSGGSSGGSTGSLNVLTSEYQAFQMSVGRGKSFQIDNENHNVLVDGISGNVVKLTIKSDPITITLSEGETQEVDISSDLDYLLSVSALSVSGNTVSIQLKQVVRPTPVVVPDTQETPSLELESDEIADKSTPFAAITGAVTGLSDLPLLENIYWIIAVFICVIVLFLLTRRSTRAYIKIAFRKVLRDSDGSNKK